MEEVLYSFYSCSPIDIGWELLPTIPEVIRQQLADIDVLSPDDGLDVHIRKAKEFSDLWDYVRREAKARGHWVENDTMRSYAGVRVLWLPDPDQAEFAPAFVWKIDANGTTTIASPWQLKWLEHYR